jgi:hypothetical protein
MPKEDILPIIPMQVAGEQTDIVEEKQATELEEAHRYFMDARKRLLDINNWGEIIEGVTCSFTLIGTDSLVKKGIPAVGGYFRIDISGPGSSAGKGYDWVKVELLEDAVAPEASFEFTAIRVRPTVDLWWL